MIQVSSIAIQILRERKIRNKYKYVTIFHVHTTVIYTRTQCLYAGNTIH